MFFFQIVELGRYLLYPLPPRTQEAQQNTIQTKECAAFSRKADACDSTTMAGWRQGRTTTGGAETWRPETEAARSSTASVL